MTTRHAFSTAFSTQPEPEMFFLLVACALSVPTTEHTASMAREARVFVRGGDLRYGMVVISDKVRQSPCTQNVTTHQTRCKSSIGH
jgi:hypothetical protein